MAGGEPVAVVSRGDVGVVDERNGFEAQARLMYTTHVGLPEDTRKQLIGDLNHLLADMYALYTQTKYAHWNIKGFDFWQLHLVFDDAAKGIFPYIDTLAERIIQLGGVAEGTLRQGAANTRVAAWTTDTTDERATVAALVERYGQVAVELRETGEKADELGAPPLQDFLNTIALDVYEKLYYLEAHLQGDTRRG